MPDTQTCPNPELLQKLAPGQLPADQAEAWRRHVGQCQRCRLALDPQAIVSELHDCASNAAAEPSSSTTKTPTSAFSPRPRRPANGTNSAANASSRFRPPVPGLSPAGDCIIVVYDARGPRERDAGGVLDEEPSLPIRGKRVP